MFEIDLIPGAVSFTRGMVPEYADGEWREG
jgi:hypothetical protein